MAVKDVYANRFEVHCLEATANSGVYVEVPTYMSAFSKEAFVIHRLEYLFPMATLRLILDDADSIQAFVSTNNSISTVHATNEPGLLDYVEVSRLAYGTAASASLHLNPIVHDLSSLPGGGIIVPARPVFGSLKGTSLASPATVRIRGWFTRVELKAEEWLELVDSYRLVS